MARQLFQRRPWIVPLGRKDRRLPGRVARQSHTVFVRAQTALEIILEDTGGPIRKQSFPTIAVGDLLAAVPVAPPSPGATGHGVELIEIGAARNVRNGVKPGRHEDRLDKGHGPGLKAEPGCCQKSTNRTHRVPGEDCLARFQGLLQGHQVLRKNMPVEQIAWIRRRG